MRFFRSLTLALLAVAVTAGGTAAAGAQSLDEILASRLAAVGGRERTAAIRSVRIEGRQTAGAQELPVTILWKRPDKLRMEFTLQGHTGIQAYDGVTPWIVMPFLGQSDPEVLTGDDLEDMIQQADLIDGPLVDWERKGNQLELVGKEALDERQVWKLHLTRKSGEETMVYLDAGSFLELKHEGRRQKGGQVVEFESTFSDYKEVNGVMFAHRIESLQKGAPSSVSFLVDSVEFGAEIDDALFVMPAVKEKSAPTEAAAEDTEEEKDEL